MTYLSRIHEIQWIDWMSAYSRTTFDLPHLPRFLVRVMVPPPVSWVILECHHDPRDSFSPYAPFLWPAQPYPMLASSDLCPVPEIQAQILPSDLRPSITISNMPPLQAQTFDLDLPSSAQNLVPRNLASDLRPSASASATY
jgi:hypothetical protein